MYTDYKAQRPPMPDAMKLAIPKIQQLLQVCCVATLLVQIAQFQERAATSSQAVQQSPAPWCLTALSCKLADIHSVIDNNLCHLRCDKLELPATSFNFHSRE